jgi:WD40 repeat protein
MRRTTAGLRGFVVLGAWLCVSAAEGAAGEPAFLRSKSLLQESPRLTPLKVNPALVEEGESADEVLREAIFPQALYEPDVFFGADGQTLQVVGLSSARVLTGSKAFAPLIHQSWDFLTGRMLDTRELLSEAAACGERIAVSARGQLLCRGSGSGSSRLLSVASPARSIELQEAPELIEQAVFSADGRALAAYADTGEVWAWDTETGRRLYQRTSPPKPSVPLDGFYLSPSGSRVLLIHGEGPRVSATFLDLSSGIPNQQGLPGAVLTAGFGPDDLPLAICREGSHLQVWKWDREGNPSKVQDLSIDSAPTAELLLSPDLRLLIVKSLGSLRAVNLVAGAELWSLALDVQTVRFRPDGRLLATGDSSRLQVVDVASGMVRVVSQLEIPAAVGLSADGAMLVTGSLVTNSMGRASYWIQGWNLRTGVLLYGYNLSASVGERPLELQVEQDGITLQAVDEWGSFRWNAIDQQLRQLRGRRSAFSPQGPLVAEAQGKTLVVLGEGRKLLKQLEMKSQTEAIAFSQDGARLYAVDSEQRLSEWDTVTWHRSKLMPLPLVRNARWLSTTPGGQLIIEGAARDEERESWIVDPSRGQVTALPVRRGMQFCQAVTSDGKSLLWGASPPRLIELQTGKELEQLDELGEDLTRCAFRADGRALAISTLENGVRVVGWPDWKQLLALLRMGNGGGWLLQHEQRLHRADNGRLIYRRGAGKELIPVLPPRGPQEPELVPAGRMDKPPGEGRAPGTITVSIQNKGKGAAYWVRVEVRPKSLPDGVMLWPALPLLRVKPGTTVEIPMELSFVSLKHPPPTEAHFELKVSHAYGEEYLDVWHGVLQSPQIELEGASTQGDRHNAVVQFTLKNTGSQASGPLRVSARFLRGKEQVGDSIELGVPLSSLNPSAQLFARGPLLTTPAIPTPEAIRQEGEEFQVELTVRGELWPSHQWILITPLQRVGWSYLTVFFLGLAGVLLGGAGSAFALAPRLLKRSALQDLPWVDRLFRRLRILEVSLNRARLMRNRWERAVAAAEGGEAAARAFVEAIGTRLREAIPGVEKAWELHLLQLHLDATGRAALVVCDSPQVGDDSVKQLAERIFQGGKGPGFALVLDFTTNQRIQEALRQAPHVEFIVLTTADLRELLLSEDPLLQLEQIIVPRRPGLSRALYQTNGGLDDDGRFVGREQELQKVLYGKLRNYFVIAARQSGKSSFLKALERRMATRTDVEVTYVGNAGNSLAQKLARELNRPTPEDLFGFRALAQGTLERPRLWLIDEADEFVKAESGRDFRETQIMRELAEARLAYFILAGSWHLYRAVYFDQHHPLRNFAERIDLGPLEPDAARRLATHPLKKMKIRFDSPQTVEFLLHQTGCRANLIAICCNEVAKRLVGRKERVLSRPLLEQVFEESSELRDALSYYRFNTTLEKAVLRAAILVGDRPARAQIRKKLESVGARVKLSELEQCLENLEIAYLLIPDGGEFYRFPVPLLLRAFRRDSDQEQRLRDDLEEVEHQQVAGFKSIA